jgi:copper(I)-binding protein
MRLIGKLARAGALAATLAVQPAANAGLVHAAAAKSAETTLGGSAKVGDLEVTSAFTKAMLPGQPVGGGYLTIRNTGTADDILVSASSTVAGSVEIHEMAMQGEVMKMRRLDGGIVIPAGQTVKLSPGGLHLMFLKVKEPFKLGGVVPVILNFKTAGNIEITLPVEAAGPSQPAQN